MKIEGKGGATSRPPVLPPFYQVCCLLQLALLKWSLTIRENEIESFFLRKIQKIMLRLLGRFHAWLPQKYAKKHNMNSSFIRFIVTKAGIAVGFDWCGSVQKSSFLSKLWFYDNLYEIMWQRDQCTVGRVFFQTSVVCNGYCFSGWNGQDTLLWQAWIF